VAEVRKMMGATHPKDALPGTIRGDYSTTIDENVIHGSATLEDAQREIALFFRPEELL
jgi:nucleoside-diphosphate kinase